jgi:tetratricopeptide (TPR) repeat protein
MSRVHRRISVALVSGLLAGACTTPAAHTEVPAPVAADLTLVDRAAAARLSGDAGTWVARVAARADTMDTSLRWYIAAGRVGEALRFATEMSPFWRMQGRIDAGRQLIAAVLALPDSAVQHRARARAWYEAGLLAYRQRAQEASRSANEQSLRIATEIADTAAIARALVGLSRVELRAGAYDSVRAHAAEAAALLTQAGDARGAIGPSHMVAAVNRMTGRDNDADSLYEQTLALYRSQSNEAGVAGELMNLGYVRLHQGRRADALSLFRDGLGRFATLHDETSQEFALAAFAAVAADAGDAANAAKLYGAARKLLSASGVAFDPDDQYELDRYSAKARKQLGDAAYERALTEGEALTLADALRLAQTI